MRRESHVRFREGAGVKFPRATRLVILSRGRAKEAREWTRRVMAAIGLSLNETKTCIRNGRLEQFDFLGYTFQPRRAKNRWGKFFVSFLPAISTKAAKKIRKTIRGWRLAATRNNQQLDDLARFINPIVRGWMNYYGRFYRSWCGLALRHINGALAAWVRRKFTRFRRREQASAHWLWRVSRRDPNLFAHWQMGIRPDAEV